MSADGAVVVCRRVADGGIARVDRAGMPYYIHRLAHEPRRIDDIIGDRITALTRPDPAPVEVRDAVYRDILARLHLADAHREALRARGLDDVEIERREYRTMPPPGAERWRVARDVVDRHGDDALAVPGLVRRTARSGRDYVTIAAPPGTLIPVRDLAGRIQALLVRRDDPCEGPRYLYVSSAPSGPGPGAPVHVPISRLDGHPPDIVRVTEGCLKADVATALDPARIRTIGVPGATAWRAAVPVLEALAVRTVRVALDADWQDNEHVARALDAVVREMRRTYIVEIETWQRV